MRLLSGGLRFSPADLLPIPRQKFIKPVVGVAVDAGQYVSQPSLGIDVVHLGGVDQTVRNPPSKTALPGPVIFREVQSSV